MHELTDLLQRATALVGPRYFQLELDGGDPIYRERVYCYELYHQLRCLWPKDSEFSLNGELDKRAHPILRHLSADYAKPDLLVHTPGEMEGNDTIIEIKSPSAQRQGIEKDLRTLALFRTDVRYKRAIYLLFGYEAERTAVRVRDVAAQFHQLPPIELWVHTAPASAAFQTRGAPFSD